MQLVAKHHISVMILARVFTQSGWTHDDFVFVKKRLNTCQFILKALTEIWRKEQFLLSPLVVGIL